jgi:methionyl aminopeptidase
MRPLEDGDIVNIDISVFHNGYHGDLNETFCVGTVDKRYKDLIKATHDALMAAIAHVKSGTLCRDFGKIISKPLNQKGFSVVRSYCGHGIGEMFHCAPNIPHYARNKATGILKPGMVFTIEPMVNMGSWHDKTWPDDWTSVTVDGKRSAQFEHQVVVTENGYKHTSALHI